MVKNRPVDIKYENSTTAFRHNQKTSTHRARLLQLLHQNGMQPLLMIYLFTPVSGKSKCHLWEVFGGAANVLEVAPSFTNFLTSQQIYNHNNSTSHQKIKARRRRIYWCGGPVRVQVEKLSVSHMKARWRR